MAYRFTIRRLPPPESPTDLPEAAVRPHVITATAWWAWLGARWPDWGAALRAKLRARRLDVGDVIEVWGTGGVLVEGWEGFVGSGARRAYDPSLPAGLVIVARQEFELDVRGGEPRGP